MNEKISKMLKPRILFIAYKVIAFIAIMVFRRVFPGIPAPLEFYDNNWAIVQGLLTFIALFPSLAMAGLVIPFGISKKTKDEFKNFSEGFFKRIKEHIFIAIASVAFYGFLFFSCFPFNL